MDKIQKFENSFVPVYGLQEPDNSLTSGIIHRQSAQHYSILNRRAGSDKHVSLAVQFTYCSARVNFWEIRCTGSVNDDPGLWLIGIEYMSPGQVTGINVNKG
jgi:hypothetical protein